MMTMTEHDQVKDENLKQLGHMLRTTDLQALVKGIQMVMRVQGFGLLTVEFQDGKMKPVSVTVTIKPSKEDG